MALRKTLILALALLLTVPTWLYSATPAFADVLSQNKIQAQFASGFTFSVPSYSVSDEYTPSLTCSKPLQCGEELTFSIVANPKMEDVKYYYNAFDVINSESAYSLIDLSYGDNGYKADNTLPFTFYASGNYKMRVYVMGKIAGSQTSITRMVDVYFSIDDPVWPTTEQKADAVAKECLAAGCQTDFEKALWLHDWLLDNCTYDYTYLYCNAEGALTRGTGTCEAYHRAYVMLLNRVGIASGRMTGNGHVWTAVKMDGEWYQVDVTWDDAGYSETRPGYPDVNHLYFGLNDTTMKLVHSGHSTPVPGYESNALADNYFIKTGKIKLWSDPYSQSIRNAMASEGVPFALKALNSNWVEDAYKDVINSLVAYQLSSQTWLLDGENITLDITYDNSAETFNATFALKPPEGQDTQAMHRLYNPNSGEHFYTASEYERDVLSQAGWAYEGIGWMAPIASSTPVFRLYNPYAGDHHYTTSEIERDFLIAERWIDEGIGWYSDDSASVPLYRQYNPNAKTGTHNYTTSKYENDSLVSIGWHEEGIGWYGV